MRMVPVGYYDLPGAGVPVNSTAFRPINYAQPQRNPFRVFTSLLSLELIEDEGREPGDPNFGPAGRFSQPVPSL